MQVGRGSLGDGREATPRPTVLLIARKSKGRGNAAATEAPEEEVEKRRLPRLLLIQANQRRSGNDGAATAAGQDGE